MSVRLPDSHYTHCRECRGVAVLDTAREFYRCKCGFQIAAAEIDAERLRRSPSPAS